ncbi:MAG: hypothetical protein RR322_01840 [Oscillospiraceae bacterium]
MNKILANLGFLVFLAMLGIVGGIECNTIGNLEGIIIIAGLVLASFIFYFVANKIKKIFKSRR